MYNRNYIISELQKHLKDKKHSILIGARQVGKTTVVKQIAKQLEDEKKKVFFLSFEDPQILSEINIHPENIFKFTLQPKQLKGTDRLYLIIDEIQYAENPSNFLKLIYDNYNGKVKIIATGSSAFYINRDFKDSLAGRKKIFELYTLSFEEFLHFKSEDKLLEEYLLMLKNKNYISLQEKIIRKYFNEYLVYGGYPEVVLAQNEKEKKEILADLANSYMKKDALEGGVRHDLQFLHLTRLLAHQTGSLVNQNELANTLKLSVGTIENYLYLLRKSFHIQVLPPKSGNLRKELSKMPKIFFHDLGLRNFLSSNFENIETRSDKGELIENYVFTRLRNIHSIDSLRYWRTTDGNEVDFIVEENLQKGIAYEVKFNDQQFKASKYKKFTENYPDFKLHNIAYQKEKKETIDVFRF